MKTSELNHLKNRAISTLGGVTAVARLLDISSQAISQWREIPIDRVLQIEEKSGGAVHCFEMRPDIFPSCPHAYSPSEEVPHDKPNPHPPATLGISFGGVLKCR